MKIFGNRLIALTINLLIILTVILILHIIFIGAVEVRLGNAVQGIGKVKLSIFKLSRPLFLLFIFLMLKPIFARPAPLMRFLQWCARNRRTAALGGLLVIIAGIPRLSNLEGHSLSPDELLWMNKGRELVAYLRAHQFKESTARVSHPGIVPAALVGASYLYLGRDTSPFSFNLADPVVSARLPMAFLGTLSCLLLYLLARGAMGDSVSFYGAAFLALYPEHIAASRVAQLDGTLALFFMLSLLCYLNYAQELRMGWKISSSIFFTLALLTKVPALLIPIILAFWKACACLYERRGKLRFWEASDLGWLGIGFGGYLLLYTKLWYESYESAWSEYTYVPPLAAALNRIVDSIASWPWLHAAAGLVCVYALVFAVNRAVYGREQKIGRKPPASLLALFRILLCLAFVQVLHKPISNEIRHISMIYRLGDMGHIKYWMGSVLHSPPFWFYAFMLSICTPPLLLFFFVSGIVRSCVAVWRRERFWSAYLLCLVGTLIFSGVMSAGNKMALRYLAPIYPFICLFSGIGITGLVIALQRRIPVRTPLMQTLCPLIMGILIVGALAVPLRIVAPNYEIYCNFLVGGPAGALRYIIPGGGVGVREATEYLKAHARAEDSIFAVGVHGEVKYYWQYAEPRHPIPVLVNVTKPPHVDWIVVPLSYRLRNLDTTSIKFAESLPLVFSAIKCGVDYVDVYHAEDKPATETRSYEAEDLRSDLGKEVVDAQALNGDAIRGEGNGQNGMLVHGPYERYGRGQWRAVFRLRGGLPPVDAPIARILVAGLSLDNILASRELRGGDFHTGDNYRDFLIDFSLDRDRRLQFCVYATGTADVWVDRVTVERR